MVQVVHVSHSNSITCQISHITISKLTQNVHVHTGSVAFTLKVKLVQLYCETEVNGFTASVKCTLQQISVSPLKHTLQFSVYLYPSYVFMHMCSFILQIKKKLLCPKNSKVRNYCAIGYDLFYMSCSFKQHVSITQNNSY